MIRNWKRSGSIHKKPPENARKVLANRDVLFTIIEFIEDKDLLSFLLIHKSTYSMLKQSKVLEIRVLKFKLHNAEKTLEELNIDKEFLRKQKRKEKEQIMSLVSPIATFSVVPTEKMSKNLFNNLLVQAKAKSLIANKTLHDKEQIMNKEQSVIRQPDPYDTSINFPAFNRELFEFKSAKRIEEAAFEFDMKKEELRRMITDYVNVERVQDETAKAIKATVNYFCPAVIAQIVYGQMRTVRSNPPAPPE